MLRSLNTELPLRGHRLAWLEGIMESKYNFQNNRNSLWLWGGLMATRSKNTHICFVLIYIFCWKYPIVCYLPFHGCSLLSILLPFAAPLEFPHQVLTDSLKYFLPIDTPSHRIIVGIGIHIFCTNTLKKPNCQLKVTRASKWKKEKVLGFSFITACRFIVAYYYIILDSQEITNRLKSFFFAVCSMTHIKCVFLLLFCFAFHKDLQCKTWIYADSCVW